MKVPEDWELLKKVSHAEIKPFVKECLEVKGFYKNFYLAIMLVSIIFLTGLISFLITRYIRTGETIGLFQFVLALLFSFSLLIVLHELLHAAAYKLKGATKIYFGANIKKFIFYAGSDLHIINGKAFRVVALFPFITVFLTTLFLSLIFSDLRIFFITICALHNLFCGGDFAMLNYIDQYSPTKIITYDSKKLKESYFYISAKK